MTPGILPFAASRPAPLFAPLLRRSAPKSNQKGLAPTTVVRFASCESNCPVLLGVAGLRRQYIHVLLRKRGDPSPRPCGPFSATPAMLGTANGALVHEFVHPCTAPTQSSASMLIGCELLPLLLRQDAAATGPPVARRACAGRSPKGGAHDARQFAVSTWMCCQRTAGARSRTWRAGCPEGATPGVCFFGYFLCTSKESGPLAAGEWKLCTSKRQAESKELDSSLRWNDERKGSTRIPACAGMTSETNARIARGLRDGHPHPTLSRQREMEKISQHSDEASAAPVCVISTWSNPSRRRPCARCRSPWRSIGCCLRNIPGGIPSCRRT